MKRHGYIARRFRVNGDRRFRRLAEFSERRGQYGVEPYTYPKHQRNGSGVEGPVVFFSGGDHGLCNRDETGAGSRATTVRENTSVTATRDRMSPRSEPGNAYWSCSYRRFGI